MAAKLKTHAKPNERRRHLRVEVTLLAVICFRIAANFRADCEYVTRGVAISAPVRGAIGERVVIYLDQIGRVEGQIVRHTQGGFAVQMTMPFVKREKIANQLTWIINRDLLGIPEGRNHERITPLRRHSILHVDGDNEQIVQLIDVSISGAAISTSAKPAVGTKVKLGQTNGEIVRAFEGGLAVRSIR